MMDFYLFLLVWIQYFLRNHIKFNYLDNYENPGFSINNTVGTIVLRWEYKLGSTFYIVYNINNSNYFSQETQEWSKNSDNAIFIKFNYWLKI